MSVQAVWRRSWSSHSGVLLWLAVTALTLFILAAFGVMVWVFVFFASHMIDAARDGNTTLALAYGFLLLIIVAPWSRRSK